VNQATTLKEEKLMATTTLAATLNTPVSELRPATMDRILVIEHDGALRKILQRLFSSEGYDSSRPVPPARIAFRSCVTWPPPLFMAASKSGPLHKFVSAVRWLARGFLYPNDWRAIFFPTPLWSFG
jgi:hypothetical protein